MPGIANTGRPQPTGRYRFRKGWLGPVMQRETVDAEDVTRWEDVSRASLVPERIFAIVRPSQWEAMRKADEMTAQLERLKVQREAKAASDRARKRKGKPEFEASRLAP